MKKFWIVGGLAVAVLVVAAIVLVPQATAGGAKDKGDDECVLVCHIPPGNPSNARTICVGGRAVDAHLGHGDTPGPCGTGCNGNHETCKEQNPGTCYQSICLADGTCEHHFLPNDAECTQPCGVACTGTCSSETGACVPVT